MPSIESAYRYRIADLTLDPTRRQVLRGREPLELSNRVYRLMLALVEDAPGVVAHDTLAERAWGPRRVVTPDNLTQHVALLRRALGDDAAAPRYIEAVRGEGYRLIPAVLRAAPAAGGIPRWLPASVTLAAITLAVIVGVRYFDAAELNPVAGGERQSDGPPAAPAPPADPRKLLVLPFKSQSGDPGHQYFADGLTDELIYQLARYDGLLVMGRTTSFALRDFSGDIRDLAAEYGIAYVLEGSMRAGGDDLRIVAQLVRTADGVAIWAEPYEKDLTDPLTIQQEIAAEVADSLQLTLAAGTSDDLLYGLPGTDDPEAYDRYLRAQGLLGAGGTDKLGRAEALLRDALAADPDFIAARGVLARVLGQRRIFEPDRADEFYAEWDRHMTIVADSIPDHPGVKFIDALRAADAFDWFAAEQALVDGLRALPGGSLRQEGENLLAYVHRATGRYSLALDHARRERTTDPLSLGVSFELQRTLYALGFLDESEAEYRRSRDLAGDRFLVEFAAYLRAVNEDFAEEEIALRRDRLREATPDGGDGIFQMIDARNGPDAALTILRRDAASERPPTIPPLFAAIWADRLGDPEFAAARLRRLFEQTRRLQSGIWSPYFSRTRQTAAFKDLAREFGLLDYWRTTGEWGDFCEPLGETDFRCR